MTQDDIQKEINYDSLTGIVSRVQTGNIIQSNTVRIAGTKYPINKLIWLYTYGIYPTSNVKTIDGNNKNLKLSNLLITKELTNVKITQTLLKEFTRYDEITGKFYWIKSTTPTMQIGKEAGHISGVLPNGGYIHITLFNKICRAHNLAWLYVYGKLPDTELDHIDHDRTNNSIRNLRETTSISNAKNKSMQSNNTSSFTGVGQLKNGNWRVRVGHLGTSITVGTFHTLKEAVAARKAANKVYNYHHNHGLKA